MKIKRYQMWGKNGPKWNCWFPYNGSEDDEWQLKNKLKNEYKEVTEEEWLEISKQQEENKRNK